MTPNITQDESERTQTQKLPLPGTLVIVELSDARVLTGLIYPHQCGNCAILNVQGQNYSITDYTIRRVLERPYFPLAA